ncbi:PP2C family protein-serine/threonine phosphatase [Streptomyces lydicus]|uniref:PP2C family protein-serine/threonine phosphatase n=1 Tax=Streptomyces lydicus TaxID=47763 RepID=UPI000524A2D7|nr:PP2C family protein-serine/threonine phosphatase [Streptomyces lydicus]MDC7335455.1 PP2C family protein-serine/threonine phosphatase [Streptomyces lydicus]
MTAPSSAYPARWPRYVEVAPGVLVTAGLIWNALSPQDYWGDPMLTAASVTAGALLTLRHTLVIGIVIVVGVFALTVKDGTAHDVVGHLELLNTVFAALMGLGVNRVIAYHGRHLDVVRMVAEAAQLAVLPEPPRRIGPLAVAARYQAAQSQARIGGDAYAVQRTAFGVRLLIADVRGKGMGAVSAVSVLLGAFREAAEEEAELPALAGRMERALLRESEQIPPPGATLLLVTDGVTEARDHTGTFFDPSARLAGHGPFGDPQEVIDLLVREVEEWTGGPRDDDMAVLAVTRRPAA